MFDCVSLVGFSISCSIQLIIQLTFLNWWKMLLICFNIHIYQFLVSLKFKSFWVFGYIFCVAYWIPCSRLFIQLIIRSSGASWKLVFICNKYVFWYKYAIAIDWILHSSVGNHLGQHILNTNYLEPSIHIFSITRWKCCLWNK